MVRLPKNAQLWLPGYLRARRQVARRVPPTTTIDILFCIADHFEPDYGGASASLQDERVGHWVRRYRRLTSFKDADGFSPRHTFFSPLEVYRPEVIDALGGLCQDGFGEVEVHLHHSHDTSDNLRSRLRWFKDTLAQRHGLLGRIDATTPAYAFVHGNWALDNGRLDDASCGVNDEISILQETGCFADFTMPAAPDPAQGRIVNQLYYAIDDIERPRSYDAGVPVRLNAPAPSNGLLMCQGPIMLDWQRRVKAVLPRIDTGTLDYRPSNHPTLARFQRWVDAAIGVEGRPEWIFVKVHSHGAKEANAEVMLGPSIEKFHRDIQRHFNDGARYRLHYVTAREFYNIVKAAEAGKSGNAGRFRDYLIKPPAIAGGRSALSLGAVRHGRSVAEHVS